MAKFTLKSSVKAKGVAGDIISLRDATLHQFVESARRAFIRGIEVAARETKKDTGNAAYHWIIGAHDGPSIQPHPRYRYADLRGTHYLIRRRQSQPISDSEGARIAAAVRARETANYIEKNIVGSNFPVEIYLYNAVQDVPGYSDNVNLKEAAEAGAKAVADRFAQHFNNEEVRKRARRG